MARHNAFSLDVGVQFAICLANEPLLPAACLPGIAMLTRHLELVEVETTKVLPAARCQVLKLSLLRFGPGLFVSGIAVVGDTLTEGP